jgi:hypothetical protein
MMRRLDGGFKVMQRDLKIALRCVMDYLRHMVLINYATRQTKKGTPHRDAGKTLAIGGIGRPEGRPSAL